MGCWDEPLLRKRLTDTQPDFTQTSVTTGYWDCETDPTPSGYAEYGPLTLRIQRRRCGELGGPPRRAPDIGAPSSACVTICTKGEPRRQLTNSPSATVAGPWDERTTNTAATGAPTIGGTPRVGEELTASTSGISDADGLDDASFAHQWMRADSDIRGATGSTYTAVEADEGDRLKVRVLHRRRRQPGEPHQRGDRRHARPEPGASRHARPLMSVVMGLATLVLLVAVDPLAQGYEPEQARALYRDIADDVVALPGVRSASWARRAPLAPGGSSGSVFTLDGGTAPEPDAANVAVNYVDSRFFDTVGIPVVLGRGFREEDAAGDRRVALVSERAARQLWPGQDAIGRRIVNADTGGEPFDVIGVARDAHMGQTPFDRPPFVLYPFGPRLAWSATLHVRTDGPVSAATAMVTEAIHRRDPTLAVFGAGSMDTALRSQPLLVIVRLGAAVIASFGMLGLLLATVGLYGVVSQATAQRRQEFGIRTALGATPAAITRLALGRGVVLTALGLALGAVAAAAARRLTTGFLVDIGPGDPVVFAVVGFLLAGTALAACLVPSRRAARADPLATLRAD